MPRFYLFQNNDRRHHRVETVRHVAERNGLQVRHTTGKNQQRTKNKGSGKGTQRQTHGTPATTQSS
jgi:hypothetical protein